MESLQALLPSTSLLRLESYSIEAGDCFLLNLSSTRTIVPCPLYGGYAWINPPIATSFSGQQQHQFLALLCFILIDSLVCSYTNQTRELMRPRKSKGFLKSDSKNPFVFCYCHPGIELFLQEATLQLSSPQMRFTTQFEMDECGSTPPLTPGIPLGHLISSFTTQKAA